MIDRLEIEKEVVNLTQQVSQLTAQLQATRGALAYADSILKKIDAPAKLTQTAKKGKASK